jgi:hypothetical protein
MTYTLVEPHPSATSRKASAKGNIILGFSRGGAGNHASYSRSALTDGASASGPASSSKHNIRSAPRPFTGIGGAGNLRPKEAHMAYSIDEEMQRLQACAEAKQRKLPGGPMVHVGRGGAGNAYREGKQRQHSSSSTTSSKSSSSQQSIRRVAGKLSRAFSSV